MSRAGLNAILIENRAGLNAIDEWGHICEDVIYGIACKGRDHIIIYTGRAVLNAISTFMSRAELNAKFGMLIIPRVQADNTNRAGMTDRGGIIVFQKCRNSMVWAVGVVKG